MRSLDFKFVNLEKACNRLKEACDVYDGKNDIPFQELFLRKPMQMV